LSIAAIPAESIPFIGVAVLIADTGYELHAACETVRDLDQLYGELEMEDETQDDAMHSVCDPKLPDAGEVWGGVVEKSGEWLDQARGAVYVGALLESVVEPDGIADDIGREAVTFICIHEPDYPISDF